MSELRKYNDHSKYKSTNMPRKDNFYFYLVLISLS